MITRRQRWQVAVAEYLEDYINNICQQRLFHCISLQFRLSYCLKMSEWVSNRRAKRKAEKELSLRLLEDKVCRISNSIEENSASELNRTTALRDTYPTHPYDIPSTSLNELSFESKEVFDSDSDSDSHTLESDYATSAGKHKDGNEACSSYPLDEENCQAKLSYPDLVENEKSSNCGTNMNLSGNSPPVNYPQEHKVSSDSESENSDLEEEFKEYNDEPFPENTLSTETAASHSFQAHNHPSTSRVPESPCADNDQDQESLQRKLGVWAVKYNITRASLDSLLQILRDHGHANLPKSAKTVLQTPKTSKHRIRELAGGSFWYRGFLHALRQRLSEEYLETVTDCHITVDIFLDGLSPHKSIKRHLWPIAGCLKDDKKPFIIAMWCGSIKEPNDVDAFLQDFIEEAQILLKDGFTFNQKLIYLKIRNFIADAPARAWVRKVNQHNSYNSCERCTNKGEWFGRRMTFDPDVEATLRNDETFLQQLHKNYHKGVSTLLLLDIKMISQFPIDIMHLVYLGCCKRFMGMLLRKKASKYKLRDVEKTMLSKLCVYFVQFTPSEFERKPKPLEDWTLFKAVDFRRFLLYEGIVVFSNLSHKDVFKCFLLLSCAIRILVDDELRKDFLTDAKELINAFVSFSKVLFTQTFVVYNVHHLPHLVDDCAVHGNPEEFSCFKYETNLGDVKNLLRAPGRDLVQIVNRTIEKEQMSPAPFCSAFNKAILSKPHQKGPTLHFVGKCFSKLELNHFIFRLTSNDSCCLMKNGEVVVFENFVQTLQGEIYCIGRAFENKTDLFSYPFKSSVINIYKVKMLSPLNYWNCKDVFRKVFLMPLNCDSQDVNWNDTEGACIPMLHGAQGVCF